MPNTTYLSTAIKERIRKCYCGGEEKAPDNLVAASLPSLLRSPVNCEWNHINLLSFIPITFHSALTWKLSILKINGSVSICISHNASDNKFKLGKRLRSPSEYKQEGLKIITGDNPTAVPRYLIVTTTLTGLTITES